jgi:redox-sensing transcriptional repressor
MTFTLAQAAPVPTLRRLPLYLQVLRTMRHSGRDVVSCTHIAEALHLDPTQVRKDLGLTGAVGRPKVGYHLPGLIETLEAYLGWDNATDAFLVGAGSLGTALLGYPAFADSGLNIVAAFDTDPAKVGTQILGRKVMPLEKLENLTQRMHIHIGIITTPAEAAQDAVDRLVAGGALAIWNFAPAEITVPEPVILEHVRLTASLAVLSSRLRSALRSADD